MRHIGPRLCALWPGKHRVVRSVYLNQPVVMAAHLPSSRSTPGWATPARSVRARREGY